MKARSGTHDCTGNEKGVKGCKAGLVSSETSPNSDASCGTWAAIALSQSAIMIAIRKGVPGKQPTGFKWEKRARLNPPEAADTHATADALNTGILCDGLRAINDFNNEVVAGELWVLAEKAFGKTIARIRATSNKLLLYRAAEGKLKKRTLAFPSTSCRQ